MRLSCFAPLKSRPRQVAAVSREGAGGESDANMRRRRRLMRCALTVGGARWGARGRGEPARVVVSPPRPWDAQGVPQ